MEIKNGDQIFLVNISNGNVITGLARNVTDIRVIFTNKSGVLTCIFDNNVYKGCWRTNRGIMKIFTRGEDANYESRVIKIKNKILEKLDELPLSKLALMERYLEE